MSTPVHTHRSLEATEKARLGRRATTVLLSVLGVAPSSGQVTLAVDEPSSSSVDNDENGEFPTADDLGLGGNQNVWGSTSEKLPF
jgi:hypothetical protein